MNSLISFFAASLLAVADLALLAWGTRGIVDKPSGAKLALMGLGVILKGALLAGGAFWMGHQAWCDKKALLVGLGAPFVLFIGWQFLRLQNQPKTGI